MYLLDKKHHIQVRVSDADYEFLFDISNTLGGNISDALRYLILKERIGALEHDSKTDFNNQL